MTSVSKMKLEGVSQLVRDIPDFPKKGIIFKDITPILKNHQAFNTVIEHFLEALKPLQLDYIVGIESRGFIFSPILANRLGIGFIPVRKKGKLPYRTEEIAYALEYGEAVLEIHHDAVENGSRVAVIDDLLATGGTALAAAHLVERLGGKVAALGFLIELDFLKGREKLSGYETISLIHY